MSHMIEVECNKFHWNCNIKSPGQTSDAEKEPWRSLRLAYFLIFPIFRDVRHTETVRFLVILIILSIEFSFMGPLM